MLYLLHGDNELQREEAFAALLEKSGLTPDLRDFNVETLEHPTTAAELRRSSSTIPFLGDVRIVVARELLARSSKDDLQEIAGYLPDLPPTTWLIFIERQSLPKRNPVLKAVDEVAGKVLTFTLPKVKFLPGWIQQRIQQYGGQIDAPAAALLAQNIGADLRLLDQEIRKLLLYSGERKRVTLEDVRVMVPYVQSADVIFNLVDALGQRKPRNAAGYLHRLLDVGEHPLGIFGMIVRQFRLLTQVKWLADRGLSESAIATQLKLHPFVAGKVRTQTVYFTPEQLRAAYWLLHASDLSIKRGEMQPEAALDLLVVELTHL